MARKTALKLVSQEQAEQSLLRTLPRHARPAVRAKWKTVLAYLEFHRRETGRGYVNPPIRLFLKSLPAKRRPHYATLRRWVAAYEREGVRGFFERRGCKRTGRAVAWKYFFDRVSQLGVRRAWEAMARKGRACGWKPISWGTARRRAARELTGRAWLTHFVPVSQVPAWCAGLMFFSLKKRGLCRRDQSGAWIAAPGLLDEHGHLSEKRVAAAILKSPAAVRCPWHKRPAARPKARRQA